MKPNNQAHRGNGVAVAASDTTESILKAANLDWKTVPLPMLIKGKSDVRDSRYKALVRSDDGYELGVASAEYRPIHNVQIIDAMKRIADAGEMTITHVGSLDSGRRVFATARMEGEFSLDPTLNPVAWELTPERALEIHGRTADSLTDDERSRLDKVTLNGLMGSGHVPGMGFSFEGYAERLVCLNGAKISRSARSRFMMRHVTDFTPSHARQLADVIRQIREEFFKYRDSAQRLRGQKWDMEVTRAFCCELLAPQFFKQALEAGLGTGTHPSLIEASKYFSLDEVLQKTSGFLRAGEIVGASGKVLARITRPAAKVLELVKSQPGADLAMGTAWNTYNAMTYYVDHVRGRGEASATESSLFGEGANFKQSALDMAIQYTSLLQQ